MYYCKKHQGPYSTPLSPSKISGEPVKYNGIYHLTWGVNNIPENRKKDLEIGSYHCVFTGSCWLYYDGERFHGWDLMDLNSPYWSLEWDCEDCNRSLKEEREEYEDRNQKKKMYLDIMSESPTLEFKNFEKDFDQSVEALWRISMRTPSPNEYLILFSDYNRIDQLEKSGRIVRDEKTFYQHESKKWDVEIREQKERLAKYFSIEKKEGDISWNFIYHGILDKKFRVYYFLTLGISPKDDIVFLMVDSILRNEIVAGLGSGLPEVNVLINEDRISSDRCLRFIEKEN